MTRVRSSIVNVNSLGAKVSPERSVFEEQRQLVGAVREIAIRKHLPTFDKKRLIASLVEDVLKSNGQFCRSHNALYYLPNSDRRLLEFGHPIFANLLTDISGLSQTETFFQFVLDRLTALARRAIAREIHTLSYYDETTGMLGVSDGGTGMWIRERGGHWQRALNGECGILFRTDLDADSWEAEFPSNPDSEEFKQLDWFWEQFPFFFYNGEFPDHQRGLLRMTLLQRFFPPLSRSNLIPTFLGPPGSGKSTAQRLLGRLLVGPRFELSDLKAENYDAFVAATTNRLVYGVDNIDARVGWFQDAIARYAT